MAQFCPLFSGSSGNCTYLGTAAGGILIDAGVSAKRIETALLSRQINPAALKAIFVTHEHTDHTNGVRVLAKRYGLPVYASAGTLAGMERAVDATTDLRLMPQEVDVAGVGVRAVALSHDARQPTGYEMTLSDGRKLAVVTDTGIVTDEIRRTLMRCDVVLLESNHDVGMLRNGPYPYVLQERILGDHGHLSNDTCAALLPYLVEGGVTHIVLGHLSRENNTPELARRTAVTRLAQAGLRENLDYRLYIAQPESDQPLMRV